MKVVHQFHMLAALAAWGRITVRKKLVQRMPAKTIVSDRLPGEIMILRIILAFLLLDGVLACFLWLLLADDFEMLDRRMTQSETERDHALDRWFHAQDIS